MFRYKLRTLLILLAVGPPMLAYVGSYYVLSRRGYREADRYNWHGFYFVLPSTEAESKTNARFNRLYWPLIRVELFIGTGRDPASDPLG
jgi:hypothetical protein